MASHAKVTFTLDQATVDQIARAAARLGMPKSAVVREAVAEYSARADRLSDAERARMLATFDDVMPRIPRRSAKATDRELADIFRARRTGGRRTRTAG